MAYAYRSQVPEPAAGPTPSVRSEKPVRRSFRPTAASWRDTTWNLSFDTLAAGASVSIREDPVEFLCGGELSLEVESVVPLVGRVAGVE